jgi:hypothetical protein
MVSRFRYSWSILPYFPSWFNQVNEKEPHKFLQGSLAFSEE